MYMLILTFQSHYFAMLALKKLEGFSLSPTPRAISSSCSSCLIKERDEGNADFFTNLNTFKALQGLEGIYKLTDNSKEVIFEE